MTVRIDRTGQTSKVILIRLLYDCFLNPGQKALRPGESYTFPAGSDAGDAQPMRVSLEAAIFSDVLRLAIALQLSPCGSGGSG
jgi:hypothetical protein